MMRLASWRADSSVLLEGGRLRATLAPGQTQQDEAHHGSYRERDLDEINRPVTACTSMVARQERCGGVRRRQSHRGKKSATGSRIRPSSVRVGTLVHLTSCRRPPRPASRRCWSRRRPSRWSARLPRRVARVARRRGDAGASAAIDSAVLNGALLFVAGVAVGATGVPLGRRAPRPWTSSNRRREFAEQCRISSAGEGHDVHQVRFTTFTRCARRVGSENKHRPIAQAKRSLPDAGARGIDGQGRRRGPWQRLLVPPPGGDARRWQRQRTRRR